MFHKTHGARWRVRVYRFAHEKTVICLRGAAHRLRRNRLVSVMTFLIGLLLVCGAGLCGVVWLHSRLLGVRHDKIWRGLEQGDW
jgi:hypothetical protein